MATTRAYFIDIAGHLASKIRSVFGLRYRFLAKTYFWLRGETVRPALYGIDSRLSEILGKRKGFFIELGANDGIAQSNSLMLEIKFGWEGVLIEPIEESFKKLSKNRNGRRNKLVRAACVSADYKGPTTNMVFLDLMSVAVDLESDLPQLQDHIREGKKFLKAGNGARNEVVPARTLTSILDENCVRREIDILLLDVEGAELDVLKGLDFERYSPVWILVECRDLARVSGYLNANGYEIFDSLTSHDLLFKKAG